MKLVVPTLAIMALSLAPMFIFANKIDENEINNPIWSAILVGAGLGVRQIVILWKGKKVDEVNE